MTKFNGQTVINRGNRPSPIVPAKLDFYNYVAGELSNPYQVCSVHIFPDTQFGSANPYVDKVAGSADFGLVSSVATNYIFHNYRRNLTGNRTGWTGFMSGMAAETDYAGDFRYSASSIFQLDDGHFSVILEPSGFYFPTSAAGTWAKGYSNTASGTGGYIDIWTVKQTIGSKAQIYVNTFNMQTANTFAMAQPLEVTTNNKLVQRYIEAGSKKKLQIKTELVVDNDHIKESLRNLIETGALITDPHIRIVKLNESPELTSRVQITKNQSGWVNGGVSLDQEGTISYLFDTANIAPYFESDILGGARGVYEVTVKYTVIDELIYSPKFKLIVR